MGDNGEWFTGTIIKDIWTITRGGMGREVGRAGLVGRERQKIVLEQQ